MRVLVTGGTGFIGAHVVEALLRQDHQVDTLSRRSRGLPGIPHFSLPVDADEAIELASSYEAIVHMAAISNASLSMADPLGYNRVNALGTLAMLEAARRGGAKLLLTSTQRIFKPALDPIPEDGPLEPQDPYAYSKLCAERWLEMYVRFYGVDAITLRFFSVYGPGLVVEGGASGVVGLFVGRALRGEPITVHTHQKRDLTYVTDVARSIVLALQKPVVPGKSYNVGTGVGTPLEALAEAVVRATASSSEVIVREGPGFGYSVADISRAREELGYTPLIGLEEGLEEYVAWYRSQS